MSERLSYATPQVSKGPPHEVVYRTLLGLYCGMTVFGGAIALYVLGPNPNTPRYLPIVLGFVYSFIAIGSATVLTLRISRPGRVRWITIGWNIVLLIMLPFGTVLGLYGLIVLDQQGAKLKAPSETI